MTGTLLTTLEVAERLGLSSAAVDQAVRAGALQPTARTNEEFLFTERAVVDFAARSEAAASALRPPPSGTRAEWSGEVDRLNGWLKELTEALPSLPPDAASPASAAFDRAEPSPFAAAPPADLSQPAAGPGLSLLERVASFPPLGRSRANPIPAEPFLPAPRPDSGTQPVQPAAEAREPSRDVSQLPVPEAATPQPLPEPDPPAGQEPMAEETERRPAAAQELPRAAAESIRAPILVGELASVPAVEVAQPISGAGTDLSRQAVLVVQPVVRFRILREVAERLSQIPGLADARLVGLQEGVASYRLSFEAERPSGETIGQALASLNLEVVLVDSYL